MNRHEDTILALIEGHIDTAGVIVLFELFTAHVSGNFVLIGAEAAGVGQGVLLELLAFRSSIVGIAMSSVVFSFWNAMIRHRPRARCICSRRRCWF